MKKVVVIVVSIVSMALAGVWTARAAEEEHKHAEGAELTTVKGEVLDMACYLDHGAHGDKHAGCAEKCIASGLPVGIKGEDGKTYLLIGDHKPLNSTLAKYAAKTITVKGKLVERDGFRMIENAEIVAGGGGAAATPAAQYVCAMCGVTSDKPGKCPKCGMTLAKKD